MREVKGQLHALCVLASSLWVLLWRFRWVLCSQVDSKTSFMSFLLGLKRTDENCTGRLLVPPLCRFGVLAGSWPVFQGQSQMLQNIFDFDEGHRRGALGGRSQRPGENRLHSATHRTHRNIQKPSDWLVCVLAIDLSL